MQKSEVRTPNSDKSRARAFASPDGIRGEQAKPEFQAQSGIGMVPDRIPPLFFEN